MSTTAGRPATLTFDQGVREVVPLPIDLPDHIDSAPSLGVESLIWKFFGDWRTHPLSNRLPMRVLYTPWAAAGWQRVGVDPRRLHNRPAHTL